MKRVVGYIGSALAGGVLGGLFVWLVGKKKKQGPKDIKVVETVRVIEKPAEPANVIMVGNPMQGSISEVKVPKEYAPIERSMDDDPCPRLISENDYQFKYPHFNKTDLTYYKSSSLFITKGEDICLEHPELVLGDEALWAAENANEGEALYVHDPGMAMNYVITIAEDMADDLFPTDDDDDE